MSKLTKNKITYSIFILCLFIIWQHAYNIETYDIQPGLLYWFEKICLNIQEVAVPLLLFLSAYLFYYSLEENQIIDKLKNKVKTLVIPYLSWNLLGYIYFQIANRIPFVKENYNGTIEGFSIFGMVKQTVLGQYNSATWLLAILIVYTYFFPTIYKLIKNKYFSYVLLIITLFLNNIGLTDQFTSYVCYYYLGIHFALYYKDIIQKEYGKTSRIIVIVVLLGVTCLFTFTNIIYNSVLGKLCYIIMGAALWMMFDFLRIEKEPEWWMKQGMVLYCGHELVLEPIEKLIYLYFGSSYYMAIADYFIAPIIAIIFLFYIMSILKYIPSLNNLLTGYCSENKN